MSKLFLMHEQLDFLSDKGLVIRFKRLGSGKKALFTFPGVGMSSNYFEHLFANDNTFQQFHFHIVVTKYDDKFDYMSAWKRLVIKVCMRYEIEDLTIIAASIGARLVGPLQGLSQVKKVVLICPDGICESLVMKIVTELPIGKKAFKFGFKVFNQVFSKFQRLINLEEKELLNWWKLFVHFKFTEHLDSKYSFILAEKDFLINYRHISLIISENTVNKVVTYKCGHFELLRKAKKEIINLVL